METHQGTLTAGSEPEAILQERTKEVCKLVNTLRKEGDSDGAWVLLGMALGLHEALVTLGEEEYSDFPGPDPIEMVMEAPEEERPARLYQLFLAIGDMDFADYIPDDMLDEYQAYVAQRSALDAAR